MCIKATGCTGEIYSVMIKIAKVNTQFVIIQDPHTIGFLPMTMRIWTHLKQEKRSSL